jgi:hypothetical protein
MMTFRYFERAFAETMKLLITADLHYRLHWFRWLIEQAPNFSDGSTRKLENLVVTAIPYHCPKEHKSIWFDRGFTIRRQTGTPWIVLQHVPPKNGSGVSGEESEAAELLVTYRPDYFVSGHDHAFPYTSGQSWNQKLADSRLLVPGQLLSASFPNYIKLDTPTSRKRIST